MLFVASKRTLRESFCMNSFLGLALVSDVDAGYCDILHTLRYFALSEIRANSRAPFKLFRSQTSRIILSLYLSRCDFDKSARGSFSISSRKSKLPHAPFSAVVSEGSRIRRSNSGLIAPQGRYLYHRRLLSDRESLFFPANRAFLGRVTFLGVSREFSPFQYLQISRKRSSPLAQVQSRCNPFCRCAQTR